MAEALQQSRDTTLVTVTLDRRRPYRVNDEDRVAKWVGPGEVTVPAWVADAWGITPQPQTRQQDARNTGRPRPEGSRPFEDYDQLTGDEIVERLADLSPEQREAVRQYEQASRRPRKGVLDALD